MFQQYCGGFIEAVSEYIDYDLVKKQNSFIAIHPNNIQEMFIEGCTLNHCVASYIPDVASRKSQIMFIRKQDDRDTPYFSVEISKRTVKQVKGLNQVAPSDPELINFIKDWSAVKGLSLNY